MSAGDTAQKHATAWAKDNWPDLPVHTVKKARVNTGHGYINTGEDVWGVADILIPADPLVIIQVTTWNSSSPYRKRSELKAWLEQWPALRAVPMRLGVLAWEKRKQLHCSWWTGEGWTPWEREWSPIFKSRVKAPSAPRSSRSGTPEQ